MLEGKKISTSSQFLSSNDGFLLNENNDKEEQVSADNLSRSADTLHPINFACFGVGSLEDSTSPIEGAVVASLKVSICALPSTNLEQEENLL